MSHEATPAVVGESPYRSVQIIAGAYLAGYGQRTRSQYRIHLRQWFDWLFEHGMRDPLDVRRAHIEAYVRHLDEDLGRLPQTINTKLNAICGFYRYAHLEKFATENAGAYVRRHPIDFASRTNGLSRPQLADMLAAAEAESTSSHALVCLLGLNGMRIGETLAADIEQLGYHKGYRTLHLPNRKGGKLATLGLAQRTAYAVDQATAGRSSGAIVLGRDGTRLKENAARRTISRLAKQIGVTAHVTPHSLRHAFVTLSLDAGVPERDIADSAGHADVRMVKYYDRNRNTVERNATHALSAFVGAAS